MQYVVTFVLGTLSGAVLLALLCIILKDKLLRIPEEFRSQLAWPVVRPVVERFPNDAEESVIHMAIMRELARLPKWRLLLMVASNSDSVTRYGLFVNLQTMYHIALASLSIGVHPTDT